MAIFRIFKMAAAAILDFEIFEILTVGTLKGVKLCHCVKFRRNRSNRGQNMAMFRFSKMAAAAILDFQNFKFLTVGRLRRVEMHCHAKFRRNRSNSGRWRFFEFSRWRPPPSWIFKFLKF